MPITTMTMTMDSDSDSDFNFSSCNVCGHKYPKNDLFLSSRFGPYKESEKELELTDVEKAIWIGVYSSGYTNSHLNPPSHVLKSYDEWNSWELGQTMGLAEEATNAVNRFRSIESLIREGYGDKDDVYRMYKCMKTK